MTHPALPWCLQWDFDGELAMGDRNDLVQLLLSSEREPVQQLLSQALVSRSSMVTGPWLQVSRTV